MARVTVLSETPALLLGCQWEPALGEIVLGSPSEVTLWVSTLSIVPRWKCVQGTTAWQDPWQHHSQWQEGRRSSPLRRKRAGAWKLHENCFRGKSCQFKKLWQDSGAGH